jgi:SAM-dependent methyltransferase
MRSATPSTTCAAFKSLGCAPERYGRGVVSVSGDYALRTGAAGVERMNLLAGAFAFATRDVLCRAGVAPGMRAADVGCGPGAVTALLAELVTPAGAVTGVDGSAAQLELARARVPPHVKLVEADVRDTGLPRGAFDLVFCRFVLMHLPDPGAAMEELVALARPGGMVVCVEPVFTIHVAEPPLRALARMAELMMALGALRGQDWCFGLRLPGLLADGGVADPVVTLTAPASLTAPFKRVNALNLVEARRALVDAGLATEAELERAIAELEAAAADRRQLIGLAGSLHAYGPTPER